MDHVYNSQTLFSNGSVVFRESENVVTGSLSCNAIIFG